MKKFILMMISASLMTACTEEIRQSKGFTLPSGDIDEGKAVFLEKGCNYCHSAPGFEKAQNSDQTIHVELGGKVASIKTHGQLVTAVINPSHRISKHHSGNFSNADGSSKMPSVNDVLTVAELINLTAFLQSTYAIQVMYPTVYPIYGP